MTRTDGSTSPAAVLRRLIRAIGERRQVELLDDWFAEDVVVEHPFMVPEPIVTAGREQLRERMTRLRALPISMEIDEVVVHETADPEVVVGEFRSRIVSDRTGADATTRNIMVTRVRDGRVVSSRDYHQHAVIDAVAGPPER